MIELEELNFKIKEFQKETNAIRGYLWQSY